MEKSKEELIAEKTTIQWIGKLRSYLKDCIIYLPNRAHKIGGTKHYRLDIPVYHALHDKATTIFEISKEKKYKNKSEVHREAHYLGMYFLEEITLNKEHVVSLRANRNIQRQNYFLADEDKNSVLEDIRDHCDKQYELVMKGIKELHTAKQEMENLIEMLVDEEYKNEAKKIVKRRLVEGGSLDTIQERDRKRKYRAEQH